MLTRKCSSSTVGRIVCRGEAMRTDPAAKAAEIVAASDLLRDEVDRLCRIVAPSSLVAERMDELRKRNESLLEQLDAMLLHEFSVEIALRERLGRDPVDGDWITPNDEA